MKPSLIIASLCLAALLSFAGVNAAAASDPQSEPTSADRTAQVDAATQMYWIDAGTGAIRRTNSDGSGAIEDLITSGQPTSIAFDVAAGRLYWTDTEAGKIKWADLNDFSSHHDLYSSERPTNLALALDADNGKLYWTDQLPGSIRRANADGSSSEPELLVLEGEPTSLALDPENRDMYWTDGATGKIRRAKMDRSSGDPIDDLATDLVWPDNLALDLARGQMYWTEWAPKRIRRANLPGAGNSSIENLVSFPSGLPTGLALDLPGGKMYWTNGVDRTIQSADLTGGSFAPTDVFSASDGLNAPEGIALLTLTRSAPRLYWVDEAAQKIQRTIGEDRAQSVADLATSAQGLTMPGSIALDPLAGKMYWTDDGTSGEPDGAIHRANLDGSNVETVKAGLRDPVGIALDLDAGYLYWADRHWGNIYRGSLRNISNLTAETVVSGLTKPYQIALDTANGHMYWTERGEGEGRSKIRRADLDGQNVANVDFRLYQPQNPFGLALDPIAGKMYWTERSSASTGQDFILSADLDGGNVALVTISEYHSLSGIAVDVNDGKIYWTDETTGTIRRADPADADPPQTVEDVVTGLSAPEGIAVAGPHLDSTRLALTALYRAMDGDNWTNNDGWLSDALPGTWHGVSADKQGLITGLYLNDNNLSGELPAELETLSDLRVLDLSGNQLTGSIPSEWADGLDVLLRLNLSDNELSGAIPAGLGNHHLDTLNISYNQLDGEIPPELGNLVNLKELNLSHNELSGAISYQLSSFADLAGCETLGEARLTQPIVDYLKDMGYAGTLARLETLDLSDNKLSGAIPAMLCSLADLRVLNLSDNRLSGTIPAELGKLTEMRTLRLDGQSPYNQRGEPPPSDTSDYDTQQKWWLHGPIPPELGKLAELEALNLGNNQLTGDVPSQLGNATKLRALDLSVNLLSGVIPPELGNLTILEKLDLSSNQLVQPIPDQFGHLTNLTVLNLSGNSLTGQIPAELGRLPLVYLGLHSNDFADDACVPIRPENANILDRDPGVDELPPLCPTEEEMYETEVLRHIFYRLGGENWIAKTGWDPDVSRNLDDWYGVDLHESGEYVGQVKSLDLSNNNLRGDIHQVGWLLASLEGLASVNMAENSLGGCIPNDLQEEFDAGRMLSGVEDRDTPEDLSSGVLSAVLNSAIANTAATTVTQILAGDNASTAVGLGLSAVQLADRMRKYDIGGLGLLVCPPPPPGNGIKALEDQNTETDREVLLEIKEHFVSACMTEGNSERDCILGGKFESWTEETMEDWHGVDTADRLKVGDETIIRVTRLSLEKRNLAGTIPPQLASLGRLRHLNLSHNRLSGPIPPQLGHLRHLRTLALNDNLLTSASKEVVTETQTEAYDEPIPPELGNLWRLERLYLQNNDLKGYMAPELDMLAATSLRVMDIDKGEITGCLEPNLRFLGAEIVTAINDTVILTVASAGTSVSITAPSGIAKAASLAMGRLVPVSTTVARSALVGAVALQHRAYGPIAKNTATMVTEKAMRSVEGPVGEGLSALLGPTERVSEIIGRLAEFVGWHGLGGEVEMDKVYCQR